jgi:hypothetical protein
VLSVGVITIDQLHTLIISCYKVTKNATLLDDIEEEGMRDHRFTVDAILNMPTVEHLWNTYDWSALLLDEKNPDGRAFCSITHIAQLREPDVYRPHCWELSMLEQAVVLNVKHWTADKEYWNKSPMPVWKRVPNLSDLKPCKLGHTSKGLQAMFDALTACDSEFSRTGARASCINSPKQCARCGQMEVVEKYFSMKAAMDVSQADVDWWALHFDNMIEERANATLPALTDMVLPLCARGFGELPSVKDQIDALPSMMKQAPEGLECKLFSGWGAKQFKDKVQKLKRATSTEKDVASQSIENVVGAYRGRNGKVEYAVVFTTGEGVWITEAHLGECQRREIAENKEDPLQQWFGGGTLVFDVLVQEKSKRMYRAKLSLYREATEAWDLEYEHQSDDPTFGTWGCAREVQTVDLQSLQVYGDMGGDTDVDAVSIETMAQVEAQDVQWDQICKDYGEGEWVEVQEDEGWESFQMFKHRTGTQVVLWQPGEGINNGTIEGLDPPYTLEGGQLRDSDGVQLVFRVDKRQDLQCGDGAKPEGDAKKQEGDDLLCPEGYHRFWVSREHFGTDFIQKKLGNKLLGVGGEPIDISRVQRCVQAECCVLNGLCDEC